MNEFECKINLLSAIDWQRSNSVFLKNLFTAKQAWYQRNHCDFWTNWIRDVFMLDTADDFGLAVWAIILNEEIGGNIDPSPPDYPAWGFGSTRRNFNNGNFATNSSSSYNFTTEEKRIVLKLKAFILHMGGSTFQINEALARIFGQRKIVCIDNMNMSFTYIIYDEQFIPIVREIASRDLLPRPVTIEIDRVINGNVTPFGFGSTRKNFNNGNFYDGSIL